MRQVQQTNMISDITNNLKANPGSNHLMHKIEAPQRTPVVQQEKLSMTGICTFTESGIFNEVEQVDNFFSDLISKCFVKTKQTSLFQAEYLHMFKYRWVCKYLAMTIFVMLPLYTTTMDLKLSNHNVTKCRL